MNIRYRVELSEAERGALQALLSGGKRAARKLKRAQILLAADAGVPDETSPPFRAGGEPARPGRSHDGRLLVAGAVEIRGKRPGRARLAVIGDYSAVGVAIPLSRASRSSISR